MSMHRTSLQNHFKNKKDPHLSFLSFSPVITALLIVQQTLLVQANFLKLVGQFFQIIVHLLSLQFFIHQVLAQKKLQSVLIEKLKK